MSYACHKQCKTESDSHSLSFIFNKLAKVASIDQMEGSDSPAGATVKRIFIIFFWSSDSALQQNVSSKKGVESEHFFPLAPTTVKKNAIPLTLASLKIPRLALALTAKVFVRSRHRRGGKNPINRLIKFWL